MVVEGGGRVQHVLLHLLACVFEEQSGVVAHLCLRHVPAPVLYVVGDIEVRRLRRVARHHHIVELLVRIVAQVRSPLSVAILALSVEQSEVVALVERVVGIVDDLPVGEVF